jgi:hypothetical protein
MTKTSKVDDVSKAAPVRSKPAPAEVVETPKEAIATLIPPGAVEVIGGFLKNMIGFAGTALDLERDAHDRLAQARTFTRPTSGAQDAVLQTYIKDNTQAKKRVEQHWGLTSIVSQFHRRLTARRAIATDALEQGQNIANRLHNEWVDGERRRVAEEQERLRRAEEAKAAESRQRELDRLEAEALEREAASGDLSSREQAFVAAYVQGQGTQGDPTSAARRAGYKDPVAQGARLIQSSKVKAAIEAKLEAVRIRDQAAAMAEMPLEVAETPTVEADIRRVGADVTRWKAEILDERMLIEAVLGGKYGIPSDILTVNPVKLNEYARSLHHLLNRWPGVRAVSTTKLQ